MPLLTSSSDTYFDPLPHSSVACKIGSCIPLKPDCSTQLAWHVACRPIALSPSSSGLLTTQGAVSLLIAGYKPEMTSASLLRFSKMRPVRLVCRFVLQPGMLPEEARLAHDLLHLRLKAAALEEAQCRNAAEDFADLLLLVNGVCFRLVLRCLYHSRACDAKVMLM